VEVHALVLQPDGQGVRALPGHWRGVGRQGIASEKITLFTRGVDIERFTPDKRNGTLKRWNLESGPNLLYVGRVSKEKNLHLLADAYLKLRKTCPGVNLVIAGDGPYTQEMKSELAGRGAVFTGYIQGEELASLYASCDLFVFPSTTDTFGNVVLEAQASGLPVIVTPHGGPQENVEHGRTGLVVDSVDCDGLAKAMEELVRDEPRRLRMSHAARTAMEKRSFDLAFMKTWDLSSAPADAPPARLLFLDGSLGFRLASILAIARSHEGHASHPVEQYPVRTNFGNRFRPRAGW